MHKNLIKKLVLSLLLTLMLLTLSGCQKKNSIDIYYDDYRFAFTLKEVTTSEEGNTVVRIQMTPEKNKEGKIAGLLDALQMVKIFPIDSYITVDGTAVEHIKDVTCDVKAVKENEMVYVFNFTFPTDQKPEKLYIFPSGKRDDATFHYQIDPVSGVILQEASVTNE
ncbi:MAG: hypothetical protein VB013_11435 [Anaerolineaceae bacterium]|nr:hypothetical protein [Anaerolineaceae bacterium]